MRSEKDKIIWNNVTDILKEKGWSLVDLAKQMNVTPQAVNSLRTSGIGPRSVKKLCQALGVSEIRLVALSAPLLEKRPIPVISWIHAGAFAECVDSWPPGVSGIDDPVYSYEKTGDNAFGLRVEGDSMLPRFIPGDIVIVDPAVRYDNGSVCVVWVNGDVSLKQFWDRGGEIVLKPMNDRYPETIIKKDSRVDFRVIGRVVDVKVKL
jgi:SOS-response transcriptional repressor LexA